MRLPTTPWRTNSQAKSEYLDMFLVLHRFVGLLDTVGALGVPKINAGVGLSYEFYDQIVSREVQTVCQALATHDRMSVFTPCFVRRRQLKADDTKHTHYETEEVWFPGEVGHMKTLKLLQVAPCLKLLGALPPGPSLSGSCLV